MREITIQDKYCWVRREVQRNTEHYPQLVRQGELTTEEAEYFLAVQRHILNDYEQLLLR